MKKTFNLKCFDNYHFIETQQITQLNYLSLYKPLFLFSILFIGNIDIYNIDQAVELVRTIIDRYVIK